MNILKLIENRLTENKSSVKLYATPEAAQRTAIKENDLLKQAYNTEVDCDYLVTFIPSVQKYTVVFMFTKWNQLYGHGVYMFYFADRKFFSV